MNKKSYSKSNHYVPCMYLKRFQSSPGWIYRYDILVPHVQYPVWTEKPLDRVASANDLYTSVKDGQEDDAHEKWLNTVFETPAEDALQRAASGSSMTKGDWSRLVRFIAAQDVRTPVRLLEELKRWKTDSTSKMRSFAKSIEHPRTLPSTGRRASVRLPRMLVIILIVLLLAFGGGGYYMGPGVGYYGGGGIDIIILLVILYLLFGRRRGII